MKKILRTSLHSLLNMEMFQLMADLLAFLAGKDLAALKIDQAVARLTTLQGEYDLTLKEEDKLKNPEEMNHADAMRDTCMKFLYNGVVFFSNEYPIENKQAAAKRLLEIIKRHGGVKIAHMAQANESGTLTNLMQELETDPSKADLTLLGFADLTQSLKTFNNTFINSKQLRDRKNALAIMGRTKEARLQVEDAFSTLCQRINALAIIDGEEAYAEIIDTFNHTVKQHLETARQRILAKAKKKAAEAAKKAAEENKQPSDKQQPTNNNENKNNDNNNKPNNENKENESQPTNL